MNFIKETWKNVKDVVCSFFRPFTELKEGIFMGTFHTQHEIPKQPKVLWTYDVTGHGHDVSNVAVVGLRFPAACEFHSGSFRCSMGMPRPGAVESYFGRVTQVRGLVEVSLSSCTDNLYDVFLKKASNFSWAEIEPQVTRILEERHDVLETQFARKENVHA